MIILVNESSNQTSSFGTLFYPASISVQGHNSFVDAMLVCEDWLRKSFGPPIFENTPFRHLGDRNHWYRHGFSNVFYFKQKSTLLAFKLRFHNSEV